MAGSITRADFDRTRQVLLKLRGRPFQLHDFIKLLLGKDTTNSEEKGYKRCEMRLFRLLEVGAIRIIKFDGVQRSKYRYYTVANIDNWHPLLRREKRKVATMSSGVRTIVRPAAADAVEAAVHRALEKAGLLHERKGAGEFTFALVHSNQLEQVDPIALLNQLASDKMHSWGRADLEALKDFHIFSCAPPLMSIPKWKELGVDIVATVKARGKRQAEEAFLQSGIPVNVPI